MVLHPPVSVVIPARNARETIGDTLRSVLAQDYAGMMEIIVTDGMSTDSTVDFIEYIFPQVKVIKNEKRNIPAGLNRAIEVAIGSVIVRCDAHTVLPPDYITRTVTVLVENKGIASVGGMAIPKGDTMFGRAVAQAVTSPIASGGSKYKVGGSAGESDTAYLGVFRKESWEQVGGYNEFLEANEDYEFHWKMRESGGLVWFDPGIKSTYRPRNNPFALFAQGFQYGRWKSTMLLRNPRSIKMRQLASPILLLTMLLTTINGFAFGNWWFTLIWPMLYLTLSFAIPIKAKKWDQASILLPVVLPIMHLSWALGFFVPKIGGSHD